ncbi:MAG: hypothetical protein HOO04_04050, partial [Phycisphaerae bacterium]|nr:hypothetical protein [Phycisphaerae bacterium]
MSIQWRWVLLGIMAVVGTTSAATITVGPGGGFDFETIQEAVKSASNFDDVLVAPGVYTETLNPLGKRLAIRSSDGPLSTIIDGESVRRG